MGVFMYNIYDSQTKICLEEIQTDSTFLGKNWRIRENKICETIWWADNNFFWNVFLHFFFQGWFFWENQKFWQRHQEFYCLHSFDQADCARGRLCRQICPANWKHVHIFNLFFFYFYLYFILNLSFKISAISN